MKNVIFYEDFSSNKLNEKFWNIADSNRWANKEKQAYTNRDINVELDNELIIHGLKENYNKRRYTSGRINTKGKFEFQYGLIEVVAKIPTAVGSWPAIWLLGNDISEKGWPLCGEIDIMEHCGIRLNELFFSLHTKATNHIIGNQDTYVQSFPNITNDYHKFSCLWEEDKIIWFVDDVEIYCINRPNEFNELNWPCNKKYFIILNLAIGGSFCNNIINDEDFPCEFRIKNIKVTV